MTYVEFKDFLATFLWKDNDTVLIANLDSLIAMADAQLNREFDVSNRQTDTLLPVVMGAAQAPDDLHSIRMVLLDGVPLTYVSPQQLARGIAANSFAAVFSLQNKQILLYSDTATEITVVYQAKVPDMATSATDSWLTTDFLDLYTYALLRHAGAFLREDERVALWDGLYSSALESALHADKHAVDISSAPLTQRQAHTAP